MRKLLFFLIAFLCFQLSASAQLASGKWGIATDATDVKGSYLPGSDFAIDMWNWQNGNQSLGGGTNPFEGAAFYNFKVVQNQWWGFGFRSLKGSIDMSNFWDGYIHIAVKTTTTVKFYIEVISEGSEKYGQLNFIPGYDPQSFIRDGLWHEIVFPLTRTGYNGLDISKITTFFCLKGDACATAPIEIGIDDMYWMPKATALKETNANANVLVYPNPVTNGQFTVKNSEPNSDLKLRIFDLTGKEVFSKEILTSNDNSIQLGNQLSKGVYMLSLKGKNINKQEKLVIE